MMVVALLLALATLSWLSIPITVFAFLAGALAIGVGFGMQTMIKNFHPGHHLHRLSVGSTGLKI